jgi:hypothetical protein
LIADLLNLSLYIFCIAAGAVSREFFSEESAT